MDDAQVSDVLAPVPEQEQNRREDKVRRDFWPKFQRFAARLPFAEHLAAAYYCAMDPKVPLRVRGTLLAALAYFIMPFDFLPDFLAIVGLTDDIAVLTTAFGLISSHLTDEHREQAREALAKLEENVAD
ncbi:YkvA family protein [Ahrensia sp. R2A130]|uniref:YkvA family protein n=1 Tax=Ahrensia sp. R2A130 TaxID=744979 RepID=UPI00058FD657